MTSTLTTSPAQEWVLYDGQCDFCLGIIDHIGEWLKRHGFRLAALQEAWVQERLNLPADKLLEEMRVITKDDQVLGGEVAWLYIMRKSVWGWPIVAAASYIPGFQYLMRKVYFVIAQRRYCVNGTCKHPNHPRNLFPDAIGWVPLLILPPLSFILQERLPAWGFMWLLAIAFFVGLKWLTLWRHREHITHIARPLCYLLLWPGMDAESFLNNAFHPANAPGLREWMQAYLKTGLGIVLYFGMAHLIPDAHPLLQGWTGLFGLAFLLHFGVFHLTALFWQSQGISLKPIMNNPAAATSLSEFWSQRWNVAFNVLAYQLAFQPLHKKIGTAGATLASFTISGLIHECVISVPARGGYGWPTLFFLIQGMGVLMERSSVGRMLGLGKGLRGWLFMFMMTAGPAFWLFHPIFIRNVILPFMKATGAL